MDTRLRIVDAARLEFAERGLSASLDRIAARCDIRRPSLLHHFSSKSALISEVVDDLLQKARSRMLDALSDGGGDYADTMRAIVNVLRELEKAEAGVSGMLIHSLLNKDSGKQVSKRLSELIDLIHSTAVIAGANRHRPAGELRAAIAHLVMGEIARTAMRQQGDAIWGPADGVDPLFEAYFLQPAHDAD